MRVFVELRFTNTREFLVLMEHTLDNKFYALALDILTKFRGFCRLS